MLIISQDDMRNWRPYALTSIKNEVCQKKNGAPFTKSVKRKNVVNLKFKSSSQTNVNGIVINKKSL